LVESCEDRSLWEKIYLARIRIKEAKFQCPVGVVRRRFREQNTILPGFRPVVEPKFETGIIWLWIKLSNMLII